MSGLYRPPRQPVKLSQYPSRISAAEITNVDAIHPGYDFFRNANFAKVCERLKLRLLARAGNIEMMGEKTRAP